MTTWEDAGRLPYARVVMKRVALGEVKKPKATPAPVEPTPGNGQGGKP